MTKAKLTQRLQELELKKSRATGERDPNRLELPAMPPVQRLPMTSDLVFRTVLGRDTPECKKALTAVLNLILDRGDDPIVDLEYKNPFHLSGYIAGKHTIMDIKVAASSGEIIDVEMQVEKTRFYVNRSALYIGQLSAEGLESGADYDKIKKTVQISVISGRMEAGSEKYHGVYRYLEVTDKTELSDVAELHYLKLNRLPDKPLEEMSPLERLGYYLANAGREDRREEIETLVGMGEEAIVLTDAILRKASQEEILKEQERARMWWEMDQRVQRRESIEEGRQEGRMEEREEGIQLLIETCSELGLSREDAKMKLCEKYRLEAEKAEEHMRQHWKR